MVEMAEMELFIQMAQIIIAATILSIILRKLKQPNLFAYIVAGIVIGPIVIGGLNLSFLNLPFDLGISEITPEIHLLSELGAAFLLFSIGIETSVKRLLKMGKPLLFGTLLQVMGVIFATVVLTSFTGLVGLETALFIGTIIAFSSTMVVIKLLADKKQTNTLNGRIMISILLIQDFLVIIFVPLLQNVSQITNPGFFAPIVAQTVTLLIIALLANKFLFPRLFNAASQDNEMFFLASISTAFLFIGVSFLLNIPITIGAFIGGLALNSLPFNTAIFSKVRALRDFFLTIFFVSLGASLTFSFGSLPILLMVLIIILIFVIKPLIFFAVGFFSGYGTRLGLEVGFGLAQVSEFGFVIAALGASAISSAKTPIISQDLLSFIVAISAVSMIATPYLINIAPNASNIVSKRMNKIFNADKIRFANKRLEELRNLPQEKKLKNHIIIIGGGLVGRKLAHKLKIGHEVIILDSDPEVVTQGKNDLMNFVYATPEDTELLEKLEIDQAKEVIIAMRAHREGVNFVNEIKKISPKTKIFAIAGHFYDAIDYYNKKVDYVSLPHISGLIEFYRLIDSFNKTKKIFLNEKTKEAHLKYIKEQAEEESKYKKKIMA